LKRTREEAGKTREDILRAGLKIIYENGFEAATLQQIAKEAGVTRGAIYWHFKNKIDLMKEIHNRIQNYSLEVVFQSFKGESSFEEGIENALISLTDKLVDDREWWMMHYVLISNDWNHYLCKEIAKESFKKAFDDKLKVIIEKKMNNSFSAFTYDEVVFWMITIITGIISALKIERSDQSKLYIRHFLASFRTGLKFPLPQGDNK